MHMIQGACRFVQHGVLQPELVVYGVGVYANGYGYSDIRRCSSLMQAVILVSKKDDSEVVNHTSWWTCLPLTPGRRSLIAKATFQTSWQFAGPINL